VGVQLDHTVLAVVEPREKVERVVGNSRHGMAVYLLCLLTTALSVNPSNNNDKKPPSPLLSHSSTVSALRYTRIFAICFAKKIRFRVLEYGSSLCFPVRVLLANHK